MRHSKGGKASGGLRIWPALLLLAYAAALLAGRIPAGAQGDVSDLLDARSARAAVEILALLAQAALVSAGRFLPLGLLAALALPSPPGRLSRLFQVWLPGLAVGAVLAVAVLAFEGRRLSAWPSAAELFLPGMGVLVGLWLGVAVRRGWRGLLGVLATAAIALLVLAGVGLGLLSAALETSPLQLEQARVTSDEKRRLFGLFKGLDPRRVRSGETRTLRLSERDLNLLLAWGLALGSGERRAAVETAAGEATLRASVGLRGARYLNAEVSGEVFAGGGTVRARARRLRVGTIETPAVVLNFASPLVSGLLANDRRIQPLVASIHGVELSPQGMAVTYGKGELPPGFLSSLFHGRDSRDEIPAVQAYVARVLAAPQAAGGGDERVLGAVQAAFALAAERSQAGSAVAENRAAILALGMLLGHGRVESFVGEVMTRDDRRQASRRAGVTLRGRADWPQHFFVSAALTVLAVESVSDATGLLKEELDAGGGSGFSFGDLLADRSGTTFASVATRDEQSAKAFQERLSRGVAVDDVFPTADGLPEGLQDAELRARYGGVGGPGYQALVEEIEHRVAACPAYSPAR